jgi:hypothetical protein
MRRARCSIVNRTGTHYLLRSRQRRQYTPKTRIVRRAYDAAKNFTCSQSRSSRTCQHHTTHTHARADTHDATGPTHHNGTSASLRVSPKNIAHQQATPRHIAHSNAAYNAHWQVPHARTTSHTATTTAHCANVTTRTPPHARHTQHDTHLRAPHTPPTENHTQSHTRPPRHTHARAARLPSVDGMLPESWLMSKYTYLQDTRTAIASHHGTRQLETPSECREGTHTDLKNSNTTMSDSRDVAQTQSRASRASTHTHTHTATTTTTATPAQRRRHSVGGQRRDDTAQAARRVMRQHHSCFSNSCASPSLLRDYCPLTAAATVQ